MVRLTVLKTNRSNSRLQVGQQHYGLLMTENFFDILSLKNWRILRYLKIGFKSLGRTVIKIYTIHPEVQHFYDKDETNYETDKENMN